LCFFLHAGILFFFSLSSGITHPWADLLCVGCVIILSDTWPIPAFPAPQCVPCRLSLFYFVSFRAGEVSGLPAFWRNGVFFPHFLCSGGTLFFLFSRPNGLVRVRCPLTSSFFCAKLPLSGLWSAQFGFTFSFLEDPQFSVTQPTLDPF